jgi:ATP-dependent Lon protease
VYSDIFEQSAILSSPKFHTQLCAEGLESAALAPVQLKTSWGRGLVNFFFGTPPLKAPTLQEALVAEFCNRKRYAMLQTLLRPFMNLIIDSSFYRFAPRLIDMGETGSGISSYVFVTVLGENLKLFSRLLYNIFSLNDPLQPYEERYAQVRRFLSPFLRQRIEEAFTACRYDKMGTTMFERLSFIRRALALPLRDKQPDLVALDRTEQALQGYPEDILKPIRCAVINHISRFSTKVQPLDTPKSILYLYGPPGVGKTLIATEIARALGLGFAPLQITSSDASEITGNDGKIGKFVEAITNTSLSTDSLCSNAIIFIDEIDRIINTDDGAKSLSLLLPFLEPTAKEFYSPMFGDIRISNFFIILAGNSPPKDAALASRLQIIDVTNISNDYKVRHIKQTLLPRLCFSHIPALNLNPEALTKAEIEEINALIANDNDPGMRDIQLKLSQLINKFRNKRLNNYK